MATQVPVKSVWGKGPPAVNQASPSTSSPTGAVREEGVKGETDEPKNILSPPSVNAWAKGKPSAEKPPAAATSTPAQPAPPASPHVKKSWAEMAKAKEAEAEVAKASVAEKPKASTLVKTPTLAATAPVFEPSSARVLEMAELVAAAKPHDVSSSTQVPSQTAKDLTEPDPEQTEAEKELEAARLVFEGMIIGAMKGGPVPRRVRGLQNPGNLCFVNAVLQCMAACQPMFRFFTDAKAHTIPAKMLTLTELSSLMCEMLDQDVELGAEPQKGSGARKGAIKGAAIAKVVNDFVPEDPVRPKGGKARQEDAHEFLVHVLNALHDELAKPSAAGAGVTEVGGEAGDSGSAGGEEVSDGAGKGDDGWLEVGGKGGAKKTSLRKMRTETTVVTSVFGGESETVYRYSGNFASAVREPFNMLQVDIRPSEVKDLDDALNHYLTPEKLEKASKSVRVTLWPEVLVVHLKRFLYDDKGAHKVCKKISYPEIFPVHCEGAGKASTSPAMRDYALSSVVLHHGKESHAGHYTAMVRHESERGDTWMRVDDESTTPVSLDEVLAQQQQAYLLFYKHVPAKETLKE